MLILSTAMHSHGIKLPNMWHASNYTNCQFNQTTIVCAGVDYSHVGQN